MAITYMTKEGYKKKMEEIAFQHSKTFDSLSFYYPQLNAGRYTFVVVTEHRDSGSCQP